jgi:hypothetical protein
MGSLHAKPTTSRIVSLTMDWTTPYVPMPFQRDLSTMSGPVGTITLAGGQELVVGLGLLPVAARRGRSATMGACTSTSSTCASSSTSPTPTA